MLAPFTRSMTLTLSLFSLALSPDLRAETDPEQIPAPALELGSTNITAESLGANTEHTGAYTTGSMSTATRLNLSIKETPQSISVVTRQQMDDFNLNTALVSGEPKHQCDVIGADRNRACIARHENTKRHCCVSATIASIRAASSRPIRRPSSMAEGAVAQSPRQ